MLIDNATNDSDNHIFVILKETRSPEDITVL